MRISVVPFARLRDLIGSTEAIDLPAGTTIAQAWEHLVRVHPELAALRASTRVAQNDRIAVASDVLREGDELALLPPSSGG